MEENHNPKHRGAPKYVCNFLVENYKCNNKTKLSISPLRTYVIHFYVAEIYLSGNCTEDYSQLINYYIVIYVSLCSDCIPHQKESKNLTAELLENIWDTNCDHDAVILVSATDTTDISVITYDGFGFLSECVTPYCLHI
jgi:hypothetical protein